VVESIQGQQAMIRTDDDQLVRVQLGPQSYWRDHGYRLRSGSRITADCWYDPESGSDWYFAGSIWGPGFAFVLTNDEGVPYWVDDDDYYYDSYGPCRESFCVWYDCSPWFYIYAPPPPPRYHFWGPRWRMHYRQWHHWRGGDWHPGPRGGHGWERGHRDGHHDGYQRGNPGRNDGQHRDGYNNNDRRRDDNNRDNGGSHRTTPNRRGGRR
jgi:hypothetical protein